MPNRIYIGPDTYVRDGQAVTRIGALEAHEAATATDLQLAAQQRWLSETLAEHARTADGDGRELRTIDDQGHSWSLTRGRARIHGRVIWTVELLSPLREYVCPIDLDARLWVDWVLRVQPGVPHAPQEFGALDLAACPF